MPEGGRFERYHPVCGLAAVKTDYTDPQTWDLRANGHLSFLCHSTQRKTAVYPSDARQACQMLTMDSFVIPRVCHNNAQQIVGITAHQVTLHHFGDIPSRTFEGRQITVLLTVQSDGCKTLSGKPAID